MSDNIFFDTDCLLCFLKIGQAKLITLLDYGNLFVPQEVYDEIAKFNGGFSREKNYLDTMISKHEIFTVDIDMPTKQSDIFLYLISNRPPDNYKMGRGEAAAIALASVEGGVVASNNLKDVLQPIERYSLRHLTTSRILSLLYESNKINMKDAEDIWKDIIDHNQILPTVSFADYYSQLWPNEKALI